MGVFDSVWVPCPKCGKKNEFQSKGGECLLRDYTLEDVPEDVLSDINRHPVECECGRKYKVGVKCAPLDASNPESEDRWCCTEGMSYSLESLGDDAWLTGCPLCGLSDCGCNLTPEQIKERDEFYVSNNGEESVEHLMVCERRKMKNELSLGCHTSEEEAVRRFGENWRLELIKKRWNDSADEFNQWDELDSDEKCQFVIACFLKLPQEDNA